MLNGKGFESRAPLGAEGVAGDPRGSAPPAASPLRVLGASAAPLPLNAESRVGRDTAGLGTRFLTTLPHLADDGPAAAGEGGFIEQALTYLNKQAGRLFFEEESP